MRAMDEFADADVTINDWGVLDGARENAPYAIIETSDDYITKKDGSVATDNIKIIVHLFVAFLDYTSALNEFRDLRDAVKTQVNDGNNRSVNGLPGLRIPSIRNGGKIEGLYRKGLSPEQIRGANPVYLWQPQIFEIQTF